MQTEDPTTDLSPRDRKMTALRLTAFTYLYSQIVCLVTVLKGFLFPTTQSKKTTRTTPLSERGETKIPASL